MVFILKKDARTCLACTCLKGRNSIERSFFGYYYLHLPPKHILEMIDPDK